MLQYDRIDVSEGIDTNKTSASKECDICYYWYFKDVGFKYEPYICNGCHDISMMAYELKNIVMLNVKGVDYICILWGISKWQMVQKVMEKIVTRFKGKLIKMIKDAGSSFDDYLISPKIRQILLDWGYELTEKYFFINSTN